MSQLLKMLGAGADMADLIQYLNENPKFQISASGGLSISGPNGSLITPIGITQLSMSSAQAVANDTATPLQFDSAILDTFGTWVIGSPSNIVVPAEATRMRVMYHCEWSIDATKTGYRSLRMLVNGSTTVSPYVSSTTVGLPNGAISDHNNCVSLIMPCTAGDILTFSARHTMGSSINLIAASQRAVVEWFAG